MSFIGPIAKLDQIMLTAKYKDVVTPMLMHLTALNIMS